MIHYKSTKIQFYQILPQYHFKGTKHVDFRSMDRLKHGFPAPGRSSPCWAQTHPTAETRTEGRAEALWNETPGTGGDVRNKSTGSWYGFNPKKYPLVNVYITMERSTVFLWVNPLFLWPCSSSQTASLPEAIWITISDVFEDNFFEENLLHHVLPVGFWQPTCLRVYQFMIIYARWSDPRKLLAHGFFHQNDALKFGRQWSVAVWKIVGNSGGLSKPSPV